MYRIAEQTAVSQSLLSLNTIRELPALLKYCQEHVLYQDENRHGDIFNALLRSQPSLWKNWKAHLWSGFFLLTVFATHSLTVHERADFYKSIGMDPTEYDMEIIRKTNETAARAFPAILNVDHPEFFRRMYRCSERNLKLTEIDNSNSPKFAKFLKKLPLSSGIFWDLLRLYLIKPIDAESLRGAVY